MLIPDLRQRQRETLSCLIMLGPVAHDDERAMRHEIGHCNGWSDHHEGAAVRGRRGGRGEKGREGEGERGGEGGWERKGGGGG